MHAQIALYTPKLHRILINSTVSNQNALYTDKQYRTHTNSSLRIALHKHT